MNLLWDRWTDFPDYIVGITREIWEDRGIETLNRYYAPDIPVRTPMGVSVGNKATMAATMGTLAEFPDRELLAEDVIWCGDPAAGFLSSHRILSTGTHTHDGVFGPATGRRFAIRVIADCAARDGVIDDSWALEAELRIDMWPEGSLESLDLVTTSRRGDPLREIISSITLVLLRRFLYDFYAASASFLLMLSFVKSESRPLSSYVE